MMMTTMGLNVNKEYYPRIDISFGFLEIVQEFAS